MTGLRAALAAVLASVLVLTLGPGLEAHAEGTSNPLIIAPESTDPLYTGFAGPFEVDFTAAPYGTYTSTVTEADVPVGVQDEYVWQEGAEPRAEFTSGPLPAGEYVFSVTDGNGHEATLEFEIRGPQPRCSAVTPTRISVNRAEVNVSARLATNCQAAGVTYASWDIRHVVGGFKNIISFTNTTTDSWRFGTGQPLGMYYAVPTGVTTSTDDVVLQNTPRTIIRLASRLSLSATRDGRRVTLRGFLSRYTPSAFEFRGWRAHRVVLSSRACDTCAWRTIGTPLTNSRGRVTITVRSAAVRRYRITTLGTNAVWAPPADYLRR